MLLTNVKKTIKNLTLIGILSLILLSISGSKINAAWLCPFTDNCDPTALSSCNNDPANCNCIADGAECNENSPYDGSNQCNQDGDWEYLFNFTCIRGAEAIESCSAAWTYEFNTCSAADRCEDPGAGNSPGQCGGAGQSGYNDSGVIIYGHCGASTCPAEGCMNGWWSKTCCKTSGSGGVGDTLTC